MSTPPKFWEKTVEYCFVLQAARARQFDFVAPLSGVEEHAAGDAIFGQNDSLILVEFKVDHTVLKSEEVLFHNYKDAKNQMAGKDGHHFLVYAGDSARSGQPLPELDAKTYFGRYKLRSAMDCLDNGIGPKKFRKYLEDLFLLKTEDGRSKEGQIRPDRLASVIGVSADRKNMSTITLYDYARHMFPNLMFALDDKASNQPSVSRGLRP